MISRNQLDLTLIELMIAVATIGILNTATTPAYQSYTQDAANDACIADAK